MSTLGSFSYTFIVITGLHDYYPTIINKCYAKILTEQGDGRGEKKRPREVGRGGREKGEKEEGDGSDTCVDISVHIT